jgi:hypothetical protein
MLLHLWVQPYHDKIVNNADSLSHILLVCISLLLTRFMPPYSTAVQVVAFLFVVPGFIVFVLITFAHGYTRFKTQRAASAEATRRGKSSFNAVGPEQKDRGKANSTHKVAIELQPKGAFREEADEQHSPEREITNARFGRTSLIKNPLASDDEFHADNPHHTAEL